MKLFFSSAAMLRKTFWGMCTGLITLCALHLANAAVPSQNPLFLASPVRPIMMLNMSKDHQLFFKLYDDYADITSSSGGDPDGVPDITYNNNYNYYGYFDSNKCYSYDATNGRFNPASFTVNRYCNGYVAASSSSSSSSSLNSSSSSSSVATNLWSGNFLNWASMTRMDAIRKILYGGKRLEDTSSITVLERAFLPNDAHSFAKYYGADDIPGLTPFVSNMADADVFKRGITLCNTTYPSDSSYTSEQATNAGSIPVIRVARGNFSLWASNERWQCKWDSNGNGNVADSSGIYAYANGPSSTTDKLGNYSARVKVCDSTLLDATNNEHCKAYGASMKPIGLLQSYGENDSIYFGLMTGTYAKNKSGGVLRKKVGTIRDEINSADGTFTVSTSGNGNIIQTLNLLRIYGYKFSDGTYHNDSGSDHCLWGVAEFDEGNCSNWGNPQAEIYLESLRYLAGLNSPNFDADDSTYLTGLSRVASWGDPISTSASGNFCAPINVLQFNASTTSYDNDSLDGASDIGITSVGSETNAIGDAESITNNQFFVGTSGSSNDQLCDAKTITSLAGVTGVCPESPRLEGGYNIAGLAYKARRAGIANNREKVKTFGVALAPAIPRVIIPVPGSATNQKVTIMPACREQRTSPESNCAIVDFKIVSQSSSPTEKTGKLYINWEDSEQGGDFDQDMWGTLDYRVTSTEVSVTTQVFAQSSGGHLGFGYIIAGTTNDGFKVQSGINGFSYGSYCTTTSGSQCKCRINDGEFGACNSTEAVARTQTFTIGGSSAKFLETPLYYAAKWGGYDNDDLTPAEIAAISAPSTYFYATDPRKLEQSMSQAFSKIAATTGASATVAANSTRLDSDTFIYQAQFNSDKWSGRVVSYALAADGSIDVDNPSWDTDQTISRTATRKIYTFDGATPTLVQLTSANWASSLPNLKAALKLSSESDYTNATKRFNWLLGSATNEDTGELRKRDVLLGDIVNSDPAFAGGSSQHYENLPVQFGRDSYVSYVASKNAVDTNGNRIWRSLIFVGANDGMMHALNANTGEEVFAYIPRGVYSKLAALTSPNYSHSYLVDGPLYVGDVYFDADSDGVGGEWRTIVVGTLGAGGRGIYALDVTDVLSSSTGSPSVIFDASDSDGSTAYRNDLGYMLGKALIAPTQNGGWSVIFGNGTNSVNGYSRLIAVDLESPTTYKVIDTKAKISGSTDNGLAGMALLPDSNGVINYAYAGDVMGNMWKFNLTSSSMNSWSVAYGNTTTPRPLINVLDSSGVAQPITATPTLGLNSLKQAGSGSSATDSIMVYFGTGKYYDTSDTTSTEVQSIYGVADSGSYITLTSTTRTTKLQEKQITSEGSGIRTVNHDLPDSNGSPAVDWSTKDGWFLDLKLASSSSGLGERVLAKPLLLYDRVILNTFVPSTNQCDYGGTGWLMELVGVGDKFKDHSVLGDKANHQLDNVILGDFIPILAGEKVILVGSGIGNGEDGGATIDTIEGTTAGGTKGRMSWRQLK